MTLKAVLFDMDSTLNTIDETTFSRQYFKLLHGRFFSHVDAQYFYESLTEITKNVMFSKTPHELTFKSFLKEMSKAYKLPRKKIFDNLIHFYTHDYDELANFIKPAKGAIEAVQTCFDLNLDVVIATTPIFPKVAIMKRLKWSGVGDYKYRLITHAENMHFSKPRDEYYLEILKKIKLKPNDCLMVGNEFMGDVVGPSRIGMDTFYCPQETINDDLFYSPELKRFSKIKPTYTGSLFDLIDLVKNNFD
ncbi:MAG: HAD family hydrolase [Asgard group archaeon]|nr:HAD family hydrolase [Asgard group archaeon]